MCEILNKKTGAIEKNISVYSYLNCVSNGDINIATSVLLYPVIIGNDKETYLYNLESYMKAVNKKIKYITTNLSLEYKQKGVICFRDDKYKASAILFTYIFDNFFNRDITGEDHLNPIDYILFNLAGYSKEYVRIWYLHKYIKTSSAKKRIPTILDIDNNPDLDYYKKYDLKYEMIKKYDPEFTDFEKKYKLVEKNASQILEETKQNQDFIKYCKNVKIHQLTFDKKKNIMDNPLFPEIEKEYKVLVKKYLTK